MAKVLDELRASLAKVIAANPEDKITLRMVWEGANASRASAYREAEIIKGVEAHNAGLASPAGAEHRVTRTPEPRQTSNALRSQVAFLANQMQALSLYIRELENRAASPRQDDNVVQIAGRRATTKPQTK